MEEASVQSNNYDPCQTPVASRLALYIG